MFLAPKRAKSAASLAALASGAGDGGSRAAPPSARNSSGGGDADAGGGGSATPRAAPLVGRALWLFGPANPARAAAAALAGSPAFENAILALIIASSAVLALDGPGLDPRGGLKAALHVADNAFVVLFAGEAGLKVLAAGFVANGPGSYLRSPWNALDFAIVVIGGLDVCVLGCVHCELPEAYYLSRPPAKIQEHLHPHPTRPQAS